MNRKRSLLIILLLVSSALPLLLTIPTAEASELVVSVSHSYDDVWMTEAGNIFSNTFMVMMLDNDIGIHSFLRFQGLEISKSAKINYATLTVYVAETQETPDPGSSVTIYGIDEPDCAPFTSDGSLWSLSRPYTSASVNWNTTAWAGYQSVNVTDIVKEIINQYAWESGNDLGLQILGASDSGQWPRSFEDYYHAYHEGQAELTIVYDVAPGTPDGLPDTATFEETYGDWDIWNYTVIENLNYTDMTQTGDLGKLHVFNDTCFNWTNINKNTANVSLGYYLNQTGVNSTSGFEIDFNFTVHVDIAHGTQMDAVNFWCGSENPVIGSMPDIIAGNELIYLSLFTVSTDYYRFLPRSVGIDGTPFGSYSGNLHVDHWYSGKVILDGTLWRLEVTELDGTPYTTCQQILVREKDVYAIMPLVSKENIAGSQVDGWMTKDPGEVISEFYLVDENRTVVDTWTQGGENFTDIEDLKDFVDDYVDPQGGDPLDPDPGTQGWDTEGPWTRFKMRLYILFMGLGCFFTPLWAMAYKKFDSVGYAGCFIIMILGVGLLWSITGI